VNSETGFPSRSWRRLGSHLPRVGSLWICGSGVGAFQVWLRFFVNRRGEASRQKQRFVTSDL
jgi:hypothetical protein